MAVDLSAMRKLFKDGGLKTAFIAPEPEECGWKFTAVKIDGSLEHMTIARSTRLKVYKSLEAVYADAQRVGFGEVTMQVGADVA